MSNLRLLMRSIVSGFRLVEALDMNQLRAVSSRIGKGVDEVLSIIDQIDTTGRRKYGQFILRMLKINPNLDVVEFEYALTLFNRFYEEGKLRGVDINRFGSYDEFISYVNGLDVSRLGKTRKKVKVSFHGADVVYQDSDYVIVRTRDPEVINKLSKTAIDWCTGTSNMEYPKKYSDNGNYYYVYSYNPVGVEGKDYTEYGSGLYLIFGVGINIRFSACYVEVEKPNQRASNSGYNEVPDPGMYDKKLLSLFDKYIFDYEVPRCKLINEVLSNLSLESLEKIKELGDPRLYRGLSGLLLVTASQKGHLEVVNALLEAGADVHAYADSALRLASDSGHIEVVKVLLEAGADVHANEEIALRSASANGHVEVVKVLLEAGADVHANNDSALRWASENGHIEVVKVLLEAGADVHANEEIALRRASANGHVEVVKVLLEAGADVHAKNDSALRWASDSGHIEVVRVLNQYM